MFLLQNQKNVTRACIKYRFKIFNYTIIYEQSPPA